MPLSPNKHDFNLCCHLVFLGLGGGQISWMPPKMSTIQRNDVRGVTQILFLQYMVTLPQAPWREGFGG